MIDKCQFCDKFYPSHNGTMKCQASNYELKYDNVCKEALNRMMAVLTNERRKEDSNESDNL